VPAVEGFTAPVEAPWAYLDAAVEYAAPRRELAVLRVVEPAGADDGAPRRVYELLSVDDERVLIGAHGAGAGDDARLTRLDIQWRPFRDPDRERALADLIRRRLRDLVAGGGVSPAP